jgi:hypothetical protein
MARAGLSFLQTLCVMRARLLLFPSRSAFKRAFVSNFFFACQCSRSRVPNYVTHSNFATLKEKKLSAWHTPSLLVDIAQYTVEGCELCSKSRSACTPITHCM